MKVIGSIEEAEQAVGEELGVGEWRLVDQQMIDAFADVTDDHQWIHVDVERAKAESQYGATIAHGFLTLSLIPTLSADNYRIVNSKMRLNYGLNKVRFLSAVTANSRIRARSVLVDVAKANETTANLTMRHTVELEGSEKPAAVVDLIVRAIF
ncbi:enoyl-CoA hydratase [Mycolicibacterium duvalii]|uniref:Dehydratase n=2 Tax=Mycolicibacterium TaxID=1866885 RepID=A0A7I7K477_9MYCO|nr:MULTISPECIES: MaoC family dehydratase [Mycolicibacterium]MCV7278153.1 MaoC family dehydratase [Mycolicibacterium flavescens]MCV7367191.1 MaoC family dehydratase [Mycolicibacterium duvalii]ODQ91426.1 enoyl-CoA hydratase [Mycolicibacterium flavescens]PEG42941.1 enoyl-CoA hydratase [Mycolicibacterium duvalii]BBX18251.1 dehydratase [Mycolicibacterium duvalii]